MHLALIILSTLLFTLSCNHDQYSESEWIGHISPQDSYHSNGFETCSDTILYDYISRSTRWEKRAAYYGGSKAIRKILDKQYAQEKYSDSGYLTFRFVINCIGEVGRFIIDESGLDFEPAEFGHALKMDLLEISYSLKDWRPLCFQGENKDSYMYITYKLKDGKIIEILP